MPELIAFLEPARRFSMSVSKPIFMLRYADYAQHGGQQSPFA
jgi:hypothetical protein